MVPSWTETLLRAGVDVVGRTRYCIHPAQKITNIPVVGGTKDISWDTVIDINPDLILFDKEENPLELAEECEFPFHATHVTSLESLQKDLESLGDLFKNPQLIEWAVDCYDLLQMPQRRWDFKNIPGLIEMIREPQSSEVPLVYVIWKKPWMAVGPETFIGSMIHYLGGKVLVLEEGNKYPVFEIEQNQDAFYLFSSEPYPFAKKSSELKRLGVAGAIVDGECYSWYGVRALQFLTTLRS